MTRAKKFVYAHSFEDFPKETDLELVEEDELPPLKNGEFLAEAVYLSVDPYMRAYAHQLREGVTMIGTQVAKITESKNRDYPVGKYVVGKFGWRTHTICNGEKKPGLREQKPYILLDIGDLPISLSLGVLGMPGNTAYYGFLEICKPKSGEVVVVTGAGGAVGSHVGQIAKIKGCHVIGITGSDEKSKWLKTLGFDHAFNYKTQDLRKVLAEAAPRGVDCYFDNVGGEVSSIVIQHMNEHGRISVCGSISSYNSEPKNLPKATIVQPTLVFQQLTMKGFIVSSWSDRWMEGIKQNLQWIKEGKLQYRETVTSGFENMSNAFINMLKGDNIGKAVVKV